MSATVQLPISDWETRLVGKRLVSASPTFRDGNGAKVFHCEYNPPSRAWSIVSAPNQSPLLRLPAELRLQIITILFEEIHPNDWLPFHHHAGATPLFDTLHPTDCPCCYNYGGATPASVIFACRQLYIESWDLALKACTFRYEDLPKANRMIGYRSRCTMNYRPGR